MYKMIRSAKVNSFFFVVILVATYPILPNYFMVADFMIRDLIAIVCIIGAFVFAAKKTFCVKQNNIPLIIAIIIWIGITAVIQVYHRDYLFAAKQIFFWGAMLFWSVNVINTRKRFLLLIDLIIWIGTVVGVFAIIESFTYFNVFALLNNTGAILNYNPLRFGILRSISFTSHAITYTVYCMFILILVSYRLTNIELKRRKIYFIQGAIIFMSAFFALSRAPLFMIVVSQVMLLWFMGLRRFLKIGFRIAIITIVVMTAAYFVSESARTIIQLGYYTVMVFFSDEYAIHLLAAGFTDNVEGIGNRLDLYGWVYEGIRENRVAGMGRLTPFEHRFRRDWFVVTKRSIEVEWLRTLWRYGVVGMSVQVLYFLVFVKATWSKKFARPFVWEGKISFSRCCFVLLICYIVVLFTVMMNQDEQMLFIFTGLFLAYVHHNGFNETLVSEI